MKTGKELWKDFTKPVMKQPETHTPVAHTFWLGGIIGMLKVIGGFGLICGLIAGVIVLGNSSSVPTYYATYQLLIGIGLIFAAVLWATTYIGAAQLLQLFVRMEQELFQIEKNTRKEGATEVKES